MFGTLWQPKIRKKVTTFLGAGRVGSERLKIATRAKSDKSLEDPLRTRSGGEPLFDHQKNHFLRWCRFGWPKKGTTFWDVGKVVRDNISTQNWRMDSASLKMDSASPEMDSASSEMDSATLRTDAGPTPGSGRSAVESWWNKKSKFCGHAGLCARAPSCGKRFPQLRNRKSFFFNHRF